MSLRNIFKQRCFNGTIEQAHLQILLNIKWVSQKLIKPVPSENLKCTEITLSNLFFLDFFLYKLHRDQLH